MCCLASTCLTTNGFSQDRGPRRGLPELSEAITSFGAAVLGENLYVYSGHTGEAHAHSRENYSENFRRINLKWSGDWEELEMQDPVQGFALVAHDGALYRVGGVYSRNAPAEDEDMHSTDKFARFDPESGKWTDLPPLPEARSSLDAAVHNGKLYVIGGWKLAGKPDDGVWGADYWVADLNSDTVQWEKLPKAPFTARAMAVATSENFIYAIGGMDAEDSTSSQVYIYDPAAKQWSTGPEIPSKGRLKAFGSSAFGIGDTVWASGYNGRVYSLKEGAKEWRDSGFDLETPRFFHRLIPGPNDNLLFIGGAGKDGYNKSIESVELTTLNALQSAEKVSQKKSEVVVGEGERNWPGFRGTGGSESRASHLPLEWTEEKNVAWQRDLSGYGQSSPVVWGNRIFVTSVEGDNKEKIRLDCLDLKSGEPLWEKSFDASQKAANSNYISKGAPTPVVDDKRVYAFFESGDVIVLSHEGDVVWQRSLTKDFGEFAGNHGVGASTALASSGLILLVDHDGPSYLVCLNKETGKNVWKVDREKRVSWSSPIVVGSGKDEQILISSSGVAESYRTNDGKQNWIYEGIEGNTVASPSVSEDLVIIGSSDRGESIALQRKGGGSLDKSAVAWAAEKAASSFGSPLVHNGSVYFVNRAGIAFCNNLKDGSLNWSLRLPASCWASPVAAGDRIYFFSTNGTTTVLEANPEKPVELAVSSIPTEDRVYGVAFVDGNIIIRTEARVICVRVSS